MLPVSLGTTSLVSLCHEQIYHNYPSIILSLHKLDFPSFLFSSFPRRQEQPLRPSWADVPNICQGLFGQGCSPAMVQWPKNILGNN